MTAPRAVAPGTYRLETTVTGTSMPLALHLFEGDGWLVADTGCVGMMRDLAPPAVAALRPGSGIRHAVVSHAHADHFGGNAELLAADPDCRILVHRDDAAWAADPAWHVRDAYDALAPDYPCPAEVKAWVAALLGPPTPVERAEAGDRIELGAGRRLEVLHLPGHSLGHSLGHLGLWEADRGLLVLHDAILGDGQREGGRVVAIPAYLDVDLYLATIRTVRTLDPALALPAHFPPLGRDALRAFCDLSEAFVRRLDGALWAALGRRPPARPAGAHRARGARGRARRVREHGGRPERPRPPRRLRPPRPARLARRGRPAGLAPPVSAASIGGAPERREGGTAVRFDDTVALVTGGASGIGRGIAQAFADAGARVCIAAAHFITGTHLIVDGGVSLRLTAP